MESTAKELVLQKVKSCPLVRSCELERLGASRTLVSRMVSEGLLERVGTGMYSFPGREISEHENLIEVSLRAPKAVFCLLTALSIHEVTTQMPHEIWLGLEYGDKKPRFAYPPSRAVKFSSSSFLYGVEKRTLSGMEVRVYSLAKTIADCFKFRNKIGLEVATEALKESWQKRLVTVDALTEAAEVNRVRNVMRPYVEAVIS
ncbi:MAG: AbiEi antitoxin N-terminal domain-containing protein [Planctomycetes bacterium]|nr:AbiEi antitoxin N-terminal domain-containing protein [Planctomycetota bacterium]